MFDKQYEGTCRILAEHFKKYPLMEIQDVLKFLYQSSFGCEHAVSDLEAVKEYIRTEYQNSDRENNTLIDRLDGDYSRVHLSYLNEGLSIDTLAKTFLMSAKKETEGLFCLEEKIDCVKEMIKKKQLPFSLQAFEEACAKWKEEGYPAIHHSHRFKQEYSPSYRVISNNLVLFLPLLTKIDTLLKNGRVILAIDGKSASGKTTLSQALCKIYGCTVIHMDDFFLRPEQRTKKRLNEVGGNIDYERFSKEILEPLYQNEPIEYRKFNCATMKLEQAEKITPTKLTIVEGVYSMHYNFSDYYNLSVFLDISPDLQRERIIKRNPLQIAQRFFSEWIPLENIYFSEMNVKERSNTVISV